jgi:hypothetical protein
VILGGSTSWDNRACVSVVSGVCEELGLQVGRLTSHGPQGAWQGQCRGRNLTGRNACSKQQLARWLGWARPWETGDCHRNPHNLSFERGREAGADAHLGRARV